LVLEFTEDYPNKAPSVRFLTKMFHPNICELRTLSLVFDIFPSLPPAAVRGGWWCYLGNYLKESFMFAFYLILHPLSLPMHQHIHKTRTNEYQQDNDGQICLDILQNQWSPIYDISAILTSIQSLLCDPNPASPANSEASRLYNENRREYNRRVREIVEQSWVDES